MKCFKPRLFTSIEVFVVLLLVFITLSSAGRLSKTATLDLLAFITATGNEPKNGQACHAAMRVAVDAVNARSDILEDYNVTLTIKDEGPLGMFVPKAIAQHFTSYRANQPWSYVAPVVVGPAYSCQFGAELVKELKIAQFTRGCGGLMFTQNRRKYPNLYRWRTPFDTTIITQVVFVKQIGKWKQVAVFTSSANWNEYVIGQALYTALIANAIEVIHFASVPEITDQAMLTMKAANARIILMDTIQYNFYLLFMCKAYQAGIRGPNFLIIQMMLAYVELYDPTVVLPSKCSWNDIAEQIKITIFVGGFNEAVKNYGNTTLGYDVPEFERRFDAVSGGKRFGDYDLRQTCHDSMEQALLALDRGDRILRAVNKTLLDFSSEPNTVLAAVNQSAANYGYSGLRLGYRKYSERAELDDDDVFIVQVVNKKNTFRRLFQVIYNGNGSSFVEKDYTLVKLLPPVWAGDVPPKDMSQILVSWIQIPSSVFPIAMFIAIVLTVVAIAVLVVPLYKFLTRHRAPTPSASRGVVNFDSLREISGCMILSWASVVFAVDDSPSMSLCSVRAIFLVLGLTLIESVIITRNFYFRKFILQARKSCADRQQQTSKMQGKPATTIIPKAFSFRALLRINVVPVTNAQNAGRSSSQVRDSARNSNSLQKWDYSAGTAKMLLFGTSNLLVNAILLLIWLVVDFPKTTLYRSEIYFDEEADQYFAEQYYYCRFNGISIWIGLLLALHGCIFALATFFVYTTRLSGIAYSQSFLTLFNSTKLATINASTSFFFVTIIAFVLSQSSQISVSIAISVGSLLLSLTTGTFLIYPWLHHRLHKMNGVA